MLCPSNYMPFTLFCTDEFEMTAMPTAASTTAPEPTNETTKEPSTASTTAPESTNETTKEPSTAPTTNEPTKEPSTASTTAPEPTNEPGVVVDAVDGSLVVSLVDS